MTTPALPISIANTHSHLVVDEQNIFDLVDSVCKKEKVVLQDLSIVLSDHATVLELNRQYLAHDYITDVLSFPLVEEPGVVDGEIYVDLDTALEQHDDFGVSFEHEVSRYIVHGLLHLIGYDDSTEEQRAEMREKENVYLAGIKES